MAENEFHREQRKNHENWRKTNISTKERSFQNSKSYLHIVPKRNWEENLWKDIQV
ncbi:hypothetical protein Barb6XT_03009 [Bacteroidales bacterium Barb6XT]|nr:hypothetical protein Barb6XT_03009 [Bacteroidales bacterium Barb6XT]